VEYDPDTNIIKTAPLTVGAGIPQLVLRPNCGRPRNKRFNPS